MGWRDSFHGWMGRHLAAGLDIGWGDFSRMTRAPSSGGFGHGMVQLFSWVTGAPFSSGFGHGIV